MPELGLDAVALDAVYPSHLVLDDDGRVLGLGSALARALPALRVGERVDTHFALQLPSRWPDRATLGHGIVRVVLTARTGSLSLSGPLVSSGTRRVLLGDVVAEAQSIDLQRSHDAIIELFAADQTDFDAAVRRILAANAANLSVARVSLWSLRGHSPDDRSIFCESLHIRADDSYHRGAELYARDFPRYFGALVAGLSIVAVDAHTDPRTSEFSSVYLRPNGIGSMLDIPVYVGGQLVGVLCHEHVGGAREWSASEQQFAVSIGQMLSLTIESRSRQRAEEALRQSEAQYRTIIETALDAVVTTDDDGVVEGWSRRAAQLFGWRADEAIGRPLAELAFPEADRKRLARGLGALDHSGSSSAHLEELVLQTRDGRRFPAEAAVTAVTIGGRHLYSGFLRDITERKQLEEELRRQAFHDALTGLPNRAFFLKLLEHELERMKRQESRPFAVLFLDLDGFKLVNDSLGHDAGDELLKGIAALLKTCVRTSDVAARLGGDEFTVLAVDLAGKEDAVALAERILSALHQPFAIAGREVVASGSIGILLADPGYRTADQIMRDADAAMYRAKEHGKSRYEIFDRQMFEQNLERLELEEDLRHAIERDQLRVYYQPLVSLASGEIVGFEALLRWERRPGELVPPGTFLPIAEGTRLILQIGRWVLEQAVGQVAAWNARYDRRLSVSVNVAPRQFNEPELPSQIEAVLAAAGLSADLLRIECSEQIVLKGGAKVGELLRRLPGRVCIDDFGTGFSALSRLLELNVRSVKVDRSFTERLAETQEIVRAIVALALQLKMEVMVEAVENADMRARLKDVGCQIAQGWLFAPALPPDKAEALLRDHVRF